MPSPQQEVQEAIECLDTEIKELQREKSFLQSLEIRPVTCREWHTICETALRNSNLLLEIAKQTFPMGSNFKVGCNYVTFEWKKLTICCPTSRQIYFEVRRTDNCGKPIFFDSLYHSERIAAAKTYYETVETKQSIYCRAKTRYPSCKPFFAVCRYVVSGCWTEKEVTERLKVQIAEIEQKEEKARKQYQDNLEDYEKSWREFFVELNPFIQAWYGDDKPLIDVKCHGLSDRDKIRFQITGEP